MRTESAAEASTDEATGSRDVRVASGYRLGRLLGHGGMGTVYEAENVWTGRKVAIKFLAANGSSNSAERRTTMSAELVERFMREARVATNLGHPNVVDVLDMGRWKDDGALFIAYEYLGGGTLREVLSREGRLSVSECYRWLVPVMQALSAAHDAGVIHRDFKPENVMLAARADGTTVPKVIDFGIAKALGDDDPSVTRTGVSLGTARYMSPEQARDARSVDARCDVWAAGVVWFEALAGAPPFAHDSYNQVVAALLTQEPPRLRDVAPDIDPGLAAAVDRALAVDVEKRWPSMRAFLDALDPCGQTGEPSHANPSESGLALATLGATASAAGSRAARWPMRFALVAAVAIAAAVMVQRLAHVAAPARRNGVLSSAARASVPPTALGESAPVLAFPHEVVARDAVEVAPSTVPGRAVPAHVSATVSARVVPRHGSQSSPTHKVTTVGVGPVNGAPVLEP